MYQLTTLTHGGIICRFYLFCVVHRQTATLNAIKLLILQLIRSAINCIVKLLLKVVKETIPMLCLIGQQYFKNYFTGIQI